MIWLLGGYMWLYIHRPFEVWPALGALQIERGYMLVMLIAWMVSPTKTFIGSRMHAAFGLFSFAMFASFALSPHAHEPGIYEVIETYAKVAVFYVLFTTSVLTDDDLRRVMFAFMLSVGLYAAHSLLEFMNGRYQWRMGITRMIGVDQTYSDPNAFASTLLYSLPFVLPFWLERPQRVSRPLMLTFIGGVLTCILLTGSRAGFMGICTLAAILFFSHSKRKFQAILFGGLAAMVAFVVLSAVLPEELQNRYLTLVDSSRGPENAQVSAEGRIDGLMHGLRVWQRSPLLGHGPATFGFSTGRGGNAHNLYGQLLSEIGLLGAVAMIALLVCYLRNWRETRRLADQMALPSNDFTYQVSRAVSINVVLLLVMGWAGHNLYRYNWQWFAAFGVVALHCLRQRAADPELLYQQQLQQAEAEFADAYYNPEHAAAALQGYHT